MAKTEIKKTLNLTFPRLEPYRTVGDFLKSKDELHSVQLPAFQWDKPRQDPDLYLTEARRTYASIVEALERRREFYKEERKSLDQQWDNLLQLEKDLRENFVKLSSFIKSNEDKRARAIERCKEDHKLCEERDNDIKKIKENIVLLQQIKEEMDKEIRLHILYEKYLNFVVGDSMDFRNAIDVIDRFESLITTKQELGLRQQSYFDHLENAKNQTSRMADENTFRILGLNTIVAGLRSRYKNASSNSMKWERIVWSIKKNALQKYKEITEVKLACRNAYLLMCRRKSETPKISESDFESQLNYIKKTLQELKTVQGEATAINKKTFSSMKGEVSKGSRKK
ncbi:coiled-coil domain-containing protein 42 like-2-like [Tribolium madens]|uniref:coiled-coil domain-containing protein 42 like-2-like n=1 Tax=Tribolium madens TaxID=41895 RepID=UPI001CF75637|nr:coiled-coil domain-containing protein 42 like-2-like [Tribolium madens]